ncbi:MAG: aminoglycoside phosphotransferase family protein, partial [Gemmatimonadaceae bacterium]
MSAHLTASCRQTPQGAAWLERLPDTIDEMTRRWSLTLGAPFDGEDGTCSWVAPATRADGTPVVLKIAMPHLEGQHEIEGLRFWDGDPTVRLLEADENFGAMLLERCEPGTALRGLPEPEQDRVIAALLRRLWRVPSAPNVFRPLSVMLEHWSAETTARCEGWTDVGLVREGLQLFDQLSRSGPGDVLLATDLHASNVLRARREEWLVIDPKPFMGDPAYDATQHLLNCRARLLSNADGTIRRFSELLD